MNAQPDLDRRISGWLEDAIAARASDQFVERTRHRITTTRQRRVFLPGAVRRDPVMNITPRLVAAAAVLLAIGGLSTAILLSRPSEGGSAPSASPSSSSIASPSPSAAISAGGLLPPGTYTTAGFRPRITYTVPAGWILKGDSEQGGFGLDSSVVSGSVGACLNPVADRPLENAPQPGVGGSAAELSEWFASRTDYTVMGEPVAFTIDGLDGLYVDIKGVGEGGPELALTASTGTPSDCGINFYASERKRMGFLDLPDGRTLMVWVGEFGDSENIIQAGSDIVTSFKIELP